MYYIEKIKSHLYNWVAYIKEHIIRIVFILFLIILFCFILTKFPRIFEEGEQHILIHNITISNWSIWLGILGIAVTAIWGLYEYDKSRISTQQEKASEIAKIFSDGLLDKCNIVITVFKTSPLNEFLNNIDPLYSPFVHFTTDELRELTNNDDCPSLYKKDRQNVDFDYIYHRILEQRISIQSEYKEKYKDEKNKNSKFQPHAYTSAEARELFILNNSFLPFHFFSLLDDVLNNLEYICMNISSHAAGSTFIYQSLHQIFFDTINTLAFEIAIRNDGKYADKFYTNIIYVYNDWLKMYKKSRKHEDSKKNQNKKILNPKIKTVE